MKARTLRFMAGGVAALAVIDVALSIPALRTARHMSEFPFHDAYVQDVFGFPWWALPTVLLLVAVAFFIWNRRVTAHDNTEYRNRSSERG